jgi:hypothetical protein
MLEDWKRAELLLSPIESRGCIRLPDEADTETHRPDIDEENEHNLVVGGGYEFLDRRRP